MSHVPCRPKGWQYRAMLWCRCVVAVPLILLAACTKPNPEVCCLDPDDCALIGVTDAERTCAEGLACVGHACVVPSCSSDGCSAEAPVCDITLDVCTGCTGPNDCDQFDTKVCDTESGSCVQCVEDLDCELATAPVCDGNACRGCRLDSECASGACGDDGACLPPTAAVYVAPTGVDSGSCPAETPCASIAFALSRTSPTREHIVLAPGTYAGNVNEVQIAISSISTSASEIVVHGGGALLQVTGGDGQPVIQTDLPTTVRDLEIDYGSSGAAFRTFGPTRLERIHIRSEDGIEVRGGLLTARDIEISSTGVGSGKGIVLLFGGLDLDRGHISGGIHGIQASSGTSIEVSNLLVDNTGRAGIDLIDNVFGSINFVTIAYTGAASTTSAGLVCTSSNFPVRSTIIWTPTASKPPANFCGFSSTIAGPTPIAGASATDPLFANEAGGDFHLSASSPARDMVNTGPALDFEGQPRPSGARFDIGADEAR